ncbi:hypothetical protein PIB30_021618 [Stylosanthes scabra]|uniref:Uncharacterized protein n=1 Tax=Stylosanthes scabra TaxID=79078 RepID=A0ABU6W908_9FABA|nr:hypothetical protein [Stylosanthes scabra]
MGIRLPVRTRSEPIILVQYPTGASFEPNPLSLIRTNPNGASHTRTATVPPHAPPHTAHPATQPFLHFLPVTSPTPKVTPRLGSPPRLVKSSSSPHVVKSRRRTPPQPRLVFVTCPPVSSSSPLLWSGSLLHAIQWRSSSSLLTHAEIVSCSSRLAIPRRPHPSSPAPPSSSSLLV